MSGQRVRYLSLFSGIEACTVAWHPLGWECVGVAEIDPFPCAVLKHHYPDVPNLGSVTDITDDMLRELGPIDLVVGGSPCQDLSVAGKRKGLEGARSGLFSEQWRIFDAARTICGARWLLWENVPGAFSTNSGRDFAVVVGTLAGCEFAVPPLGWGNEGAAVGPHGLVEWGTLDAQWFGVAQRRRRVFALLDVGDWTNRPPVLLEPESVRGDSAPRRGEGEGFADRTVGCLAESSGHARPGDNLQSVDYLHVMSSTAEGHDASEDGGQTPVVAFNWANGGGYGNANDGLGISEEHSPPLGCSQTPAVAFAQNQRDEVRTMEVAGALASEPGMKQQTYVMQAFDLHGTPASEVASETEVHTPLRSRVPGIMENSTTTVVSTGTVRRLTPVECERLQGFPDNYTRIPYRNKPADKCPDGPRYKALGNSMAVPVMRWIGERMS